MSRQSTTFLILPLLLVVASWLCVGVVHAQILGVSVQPLLRTHCSTISAITRDGVSGTIYAACQTAAPGANTVIAIGVAGDVTIVTTTTQCASASSLLLATPSGRSSPLLYATCATNTATQPTVIAIDTATNRINATLAKAGTGANGVCSSASGIVRHSVTGALYVACNVGNLPGDAALIAIQPSGSITTLATATQCTGALSIALDEAIDTVYASCNVVVTGTQNALVSVKTSAPGVVTRVLGSTDCPMSPYMALDPVTKRVVTLCSPLNQGSAAVLTVDARNSTGAGFTKATLMYKYPGAGSCLYLAKAVIDSQGRVFISCPQLTPFQGQSTLVMISSAAATGSTGTTLASFAGPGPVVLGQNDCLSASAVFKDTYSTSVGGNDTVLLACASLNANVPTLLEVDTTGLNRVKARLTTAICSSVGAVTMDTTSNGARAFVGCVSIGGLSPQLFSIDARTGAMIGAALPLPNTCSTVRSLAQDGSSLFVACGGTYSGAPSIMEINLNTGASRILTTATGTPACQDASSLSVANGVLYAACEAQNGPTIISFNAQRNVTVLAQGVYGSVGAFCATPRGVWADSRYPTQLVASCYMGFPANGNSLVQIDITDPANPVLSKLLNVSQCAYATGVARSNNGAAFVACDDTGGGHNLLAQAQLGQNPQKIFGTGGTILQSYSAKGVAYASVNDTVYVAASAGSAATTTLLALNSVSGQRNLSAVLVAGRGTQQCFAAAQVIVADSLSGDLIVSCTDTEGSSLVRVRPAGGNGGGSSSGGGGSTTSTGGSGGGSTTGATADPSASGAAAGSDSSSSGPSGGILPFPSSASSVSLSIINALAAAVVACLLACNY